MNNAAQYIDKFRFGTLISLLIALLILASSLRMIKDAIVFVLMKFYEFFVQYNKH
jgi:hypothetical protein